MRVRAPLVNVLGIAVVATVLSSGCAWYPPGWDEEVQGPDPWNSVNRPIYRFNRGFDRWVLNPVATGWEFVTWEGFRTSVHSFFQNLAVPVRLVSNTGQGDFRQAGVEVGRFLVNSTVGILGFFDPATNLGLKHSNEDIGQMFGHWGIGTGPFWMLPFIGPSDPRDAAGFFFDTVLNLPALVWLASGYGAPGIGIVNVVNERTRADKQFELAEEAALDHYVFVRDAYFQRREALVANEDVPDFRKLNQQEPSDELYELEDE